MIIFNFHSSLRAAQRNLSRDEIEYVISNGKEYHKAGAVIYFLRSRDIPENEKQIGKIARLEGTAVIMNREKTIVITAWRNVKHGLKVIRCKSEYSRRPAGGKTAWA